MKGVMTVIIGEAKFLSGLKSPVPFLSPLAPRVPYSYQRRWPYADRKLLAWIRGTLLGVEALLDGFRVLAQVKHGHDDYTRGFHGVENTIWVVGHQ
jgi:hypothetical protein